MANHSRGAFAPLSHPAPRSGEGDHALAWWKGRRSRGQPFRCAPPPPHSVWSPSPAPFHFAGADKQNCSRDAFLLRPSLAKHHATKNKAVLDSPPAPKREAERRKAHPTIVRATPTSVATRQCVGRGSGLIGARSPSGAPLRHSPARSQPPWLSSRTAFPGTRPGRCFARPQQIPNTASSSQTGPRAGRAGPRSRPGAECKSARGHRTRSVFGCASRTRPLGERDSLQCN
jgi:hypothetical protein